MTEEEKIPFFGTLVTGVPGGQVTDTDNIRDPNLNNRTQSDINQQATKRPYQTFSTRADFPSIGTPDVIYFDLQKRFEYEWKTGVGYTLLTDSWRAITRISGNVENRDY